MKTSGMNTTDSKHSQPVAENLLNREFSASGPGEKWVSDITYLIMGSYRDRIGIFRGHGSR
jgi:transposase InsO family protein